MRILCLTVLLATVCTASDEAVLIRAARFVIQRNEGIRLSAYTDTNGHKTIGIGHKVRDGESFTVIDKDTAYSLFQQDIQEHLTRCRRFFPKFDEYPVQVRVALLDGVYRGCLSGSPKARRLINAGDFIGASREYVDHKGYRRSRAAGTGVYKRMDRNALVFRRYGEKNDIQ